MARFAEVRPVRVDQLVVSKQQARTREVEKDLGDLVENIRVHGQLEPIIVAPVKGDEERFEIVAGQRRWLAMRQLGAETISAAILDERVDEATARVLSISENIIRRDLNSKDLIDVCTALHRKYGSAKAVAEELGLPYNKVRNYVKFERLRPALKEMVESGEVDVKTAVRIEDHHSDKDVGVAELKATVEHVAGMTGAQQIDYFNNVKNQHDPAPGIGAVSNGARPGFVRQIIVTLRREDHESLREWAASKGLGQDKAAAWIINAFFRDGNAGHNDGGQEKGTHSRAS